MLKLRLLTRFCGIYALILMLCTSCLSADKPQSKPFDNESQPVVSQPVFTSTNPPESESNNDEDGDENEDEDDNKAVVDGSYTATVDYSNPNTGYSATYTLQVDVTNGQVVQINFPNDGYLDEDHISPADLDDDGNANVEGEEGKTYDVHIKL